MYIMYVQWPVGVLCMCVWGGGGEKGINQSQAGFIK